MKIRHYKIEQGIMKKPKGDWKECWYGLYRLGECYSKEAWQQFKDAEAEAHKQGCLGERELEVDIFLSILREIKDEEMTFVELGAGYADWCMALNGALRNNLVRTKVKSAVCYAIEAEPTHVEWSLKHFKQWKMKGDVVPCIISDKNEKCKFAVDKDPSSNYGQSVTYTDSILRTAGNMLRRKMIELYSLKLDSLMKVKEIDKVHLIDMDVQGNEVRVVRGAMQTIEAGKIDYWKIGTHGGKYNRQLQKLLSSHYDLLVDIYPNSVGEVDGLRAKVQDGIQVYKRKDL